MFISHTNCFFKQTPKFPRPMRSFTLFPQVNGANFSSEVRCMCARVASRIRVSKRSCSTVCLIILGSCSSLHYDMSTKKLNLFPILSTFSAKSEIFPKFEIRRTFRNFVRFCNNFAEIYISVSNCVEDLVNRAIEVLFNNNIKASLSLAHRAVLS